MFFISLLITTILFTELKSKEKLLLGILSKNIFNTSTKLNSKIFQLNLGKITKELSFELVPIFYNKKEKIIDDYNNNLLNAIIIDTKTLVDNKITQNVTEIYATISFHKKSLTSYLLVTSDSSINDISDIKNKSMLLNKNVSDDFYWLDFIVRKRINKKLSTINTISYEEKKAKVLLDVYFKKYDLGVVSRVVWDTMIELNPKIKKKVRIIKVSSKSFLPILILSRKNPKKKIIREFIVQLIKKVNNSFYIKNSNSLSFSSVFILSEPQLLRVTSFYKRYGDLSIKSDDK